MSSLSRRSFFGLVAGAATAVGVATKALAVPLCRERGLALSGSGPLTLTLPRMGGEQFRVETARHIVIESYTGRKIVELDGRRRSVFLNVEDGRWTVS